MRRFVRSGQVPVWLLGCLTLAATGCVNLEPVREFAKISTQATAYTALVDQYIQVPEASVRLIKANPSVIDSLVAPYERKVEEREAQRPSLLALHAALTSYMAAIGTLASDNLVKTDKEFKALQTGVGKLAGSVGASAAAKSKLNAAGTLLKLVADAALKQYQQKKVVQIMTDADDHVVGIVGHMTTLIRAAKVSLKSQRLQLGELFDTFPGGVDADEPSSEEGRAIAFLATEELLGRLVALELLGQQTDRYAVLLTRIADAHHAFVTNPADLSKKQLFGELMARSNELKVLFQAVKEPLIGRQRAQLKGARS